MSLLTARKFHFLFVLCAAAMSFLFCSCVMSQKTLPFWHVYVPLAKEFFGEKSEVRFKYFVAHMKSFSGIYLLLNVFYFCYFFEKIYSATVSFISVKCNLWAKNFLRWEENGGNKFKFLITVKSFDSISSTHQNHNSLPKFSLSSLTIEFLY